LAAEGIMERAVKQALVIALVAASVGAVPSAEAKNLALVRICGANGCRAIVPALPLAHTSLGRSPAVQPYHVGTLADRTTAYFVEAVSAVTGAHVTGPGRWAKLSSASRIRAVASGLRPLPAPTPSEVLVGGRRVRGHSSYLGLLGPLPASAARWTGELLVPIDVRWRTPNPWSVVSSYLQYIPAKRLLIRLDGYFRVPGELAAMIDSDRG
jgi:hypothetical protein